MATGSASRMCWWYCSLSWSTSWTMGMLEISWRGVIVAFSVFGPTTVSESAHQSERWLSVPSRSAVRGDRQSQFCPVLSILLQGVKDAQKDLADVRCLFYSSPLDCTAMRPSQRLHYGGAHNRRVGSDWSVVWLLRHLATDHQYRNDHYYL